MGNTKIEWSDRVWNPTVGCTPVSPGCAHCYAKRMHGRFFASHPFERVTTYPERLENPLHWTKPSKIFVDSMSDLFHQDVPFEYLNEVFAVIEKAPWHAFLILTKRPERMVEYLESRKDPVRTDNIWFGVSVENQRLADLRIPLLLRAPVAHRFLSVEPLISPIDLTKIRWAQIPVNPIEYQQFGVPVPNEMWSLRNALYSRPRDEYNQPVTGIDWVICGGESGPGARPMQVEWVRSLRDQCVSSRVPFFFKQWGQWKPSEDGMVYWLSSKEAAGHLLDGREWMQYPAGMPGVENRRCDTSRIAGYGEVQLTFDDGGKQ